MLSVAFLPSYKNPYQQLLADSLRKHGVDVEFLQSMPSTAWLVTQRSRIQVLHLHWLSGLYMRHYLTPLRLIGFVSRLVLARSLGYKIVWTVHNLLPHRRPFPPMHRMVRRFVVGQLDAMIAHCEYGRREILRLFPSDVPVHVVPHGNYAGVHTVTMTKAEARAFLGIQSQSFVYTLLGNISPYKGIEEFVKSFQAGADVDDIALIAGRNRAPALVQRLEALSAVDPRMHVNAGFIADDAMPCYLQAADVAVFCFREVLTSGSVILAMTYGLPVITPARGCLPELVTPAAGLLYDPDDPDALGWALRHIKKLDTKQMGVEAQKIAKALCWEDIAQQTAAIYRECIG